MSTTLRPVCPEDEPFLYKVYSNVRLAELARVDWTPAEKEAFIQTQFSYRKQGYANQFPQADNSIILSYNEPVGYMIIDRTEDEICVVDIALLPEHRNQGIGTFLMQEIVKEAEQVKKPVRLSVEKDNPGAFRLYERLGFSVTGEDDIRLKMEYFP
ncbi:MAG: GNAT family N-acetyltransferase [Candidatus Parabeggiatoa sp. nov. 2]|nr:MAG: hypothetical protein B6247_28795 [Beggiatoa sp. 4572_84]RKZ50314.1 MAG: GNAT family N-acetyltransferase [Gammaproteobacteria bacterium]